MPISLRCYKMLIQAGVGHDGEEQVPFHAMPQVGTSNPEP
jgi:hypothetical protein